MNKNPLINALAAVTYIVGIVLVINYLVFPMEHVAFDLLIPIAMLSLFVFSASVMGYIFLSGPILLLFEKQNKKAVSFFLRTTAYFGVIAALVFAIVFVISVYV